MTALEAPPAELVSRPRARARWTRRAGLSALVLFGVLACTLIYGNLALVALSWAARPLTDLDRVEGVGSVRHLIEVDDHVWRGAEPDADGYRELAEHGVVTVVDLRPGSPSRGDDVLLRSLGLDVVHLPVIDGRPPAAGQVRRFVDIVGQTRGRVFLHCGEGVGRAGTMSAAYKVTTGQTDARTAVRESLAVGVLTLEQVAFIAGLDRDGVHRPPAPVVVVSRYLDAPRQLYNALL